MYVYIYYIDFAVRTNVAQHSRQYAEQRRLLRACIYSLINSLSFHLFTYLLHFSYFLFAHFCFLY